MADILQLEENGVAKYMKTHVDAVDGIDGKLVRSEGDEVISGTKNFQDLLQSGGVNVVVDKFITKTVQATNTTDFTDNSSVIFQRMGHLIVANLFVMNKKSNLEGWKNLVQFPSGFKPAAMGSWGGSLANKKNRTLPLSVYANASGIQVMPPSVDYPAEQESCGTIVYFTNDPLPALETLDTLEQIEINSRAI